MPQLYAKPVSSESESLGMGSFLKIPQGILMYSENQEPLIQTL